MSETRKDECAECASGGRCANHPECLIPATPTSPEQGGKVSAADAWIIAAKTRPQWDALVARLEPYLSGRMSPDEFSEMVLAYGASCARDALLARVAPQDARYVDSRTDAERAEDAKREVSVTYYPPAAETGEPVAGPSPEALREWAKHVRYGITNPKAPILKLAEFLDALATQAGAITCANCKGGVVTQELPDSALDVHGLCGYCRRVGIRAEHLAGVSKMMPLARYPYEVEIGSIIRNATDPHPDLPVGSMFTLKCSVGELAQRIASVLAPALAAPAPREVSEAMVEAAMKADGFNYAGVAETHPEMVAQTRDWYRLILRAALSAETGTA